MGSRYPNYVTMLMQQALYPLGHFIHSPKNTLCVSFSFQNLLCDFAVVKVLIVFLFGVIVLSISQFISMFLYYIFNAYSTSWKWWAELFWHACLGSFKKRNPVIDCCALIDIIWIINSMFRKWVQGGVWLAMFNEVITRLSSIPCPWLIISKC